MNLLKTFENYAELRNLKVNVQPTSNYAGKNNSGRLHGIFISPKQARLFVEDLYKYEKEIQDFSDLYNLDCVKGAVIGFYVGIVES